MNGHWQNKRRFSMGQSFDKGSYFRQAEDKFAVLADVDKSRCGNVGSRDGILGRFLSGILFSFVRFLAFHAGRRRRLRTTALLALS